MTVKQLRLIKHLGDKDCPTVADASKRAGYSYGARNMYRVNTKKHIKESIGSNPKAIIEAYEDLIRRCKLKQDLSNERGVLDSLCRINAMFTDKSINRTEITDGNDKGILAQYAKSRIEKML